MISCFCTTFSSLENQKKDGTKPYSLGDLNLIKFLILILGFFFFGNHTLNSFFPTGFKVAISRGNLTVLKSIATISGYAMSFCPSILSGVLQYHREELVLLIVPEILYYIGLEIVSICYIVPQIISNRSWSMD